MYEGKNCLIVGLGESGQSVYKVLTKLNANIYFYDKNSCKFDGLSGHRVDKLTARLIKNMDYIILSPAVKLNKKLTKIVNRKKIKCFGEIEFAYTLNRGEIFAVTGSNGKTTTVSLLKNMLDNLSNNTYLLGNIGTPFSQYAMDIKNDDNVVLECSSFQLLQTDKFKPHYAALLNLEPDHLDYHKDIQKYYEAKLKIFANQDENDFAIINFDDNEIVERTKNLRSKIFYFSTKNVCKGMYVQDDEIFFSDGLITYSVVKLENIRYVGEHNLSNYLCASLIALLKGVSLENIAYVLNNFKLPAHRLEFIRRYQSVDYYNDSKATNISATLSACNSFDKKIHLLIGGSDKGEDFSLLANNLPQNIKYIYLFGDTQKKIFKKMKKANKFIVYKCDTLQNALYFASHKANKGEIVLLSPACASYDAFDNFEERGNFFKDLVNSIE